MLDNEWLHPSRITFCTCRIQPCTGATYIFVHVSHAIFVSQARLIEICYGSVLFADGARKGAREEEAKVRLESSSTYRGSKMQRIGSRLNMQVSWGAGSVAEGPPPGSRDLFRAAENGRTPPGLTAQCSEGVMDLSEKNP